MNENRQPETDSSNRAEELPEFLKEFFASATPPEGYGNAQFVLNWTILFMFVPYLIYLLDLFSAPGISWGLFVYSVIMILLYWFGISGFKREMVYVSNPFDFVKMNFITLLNIIVFFGLSYYYLSRVADKSFTQPLGIFDAVYFSFVTIATVGYGDISPSSVLARSLVILEICFGLWFFVTVIPVVVADQAERAKNFRLHRARMAEALKKMHDQGELKLKMRVRNTEHSKPGFFGRFKSKTQNNHETNP